jgi:Protein of unknown function (DUF1566)/Chitobiase/beta-hexosaminidase C-terminal domain
MQNVSITTKTSGANIYYTTDGNTPTTSSIVYSTAVHIWSLAGKTVKVFATKTSFLDSTELSGVFSYPPLKSGQTTVYVAGDNGTNQTGAARGYTGPTAHGTYTGDYTTTDNATGLVWKTCTQGLSGATCATGTAVTLTWANASADVANGCNALNSANSGNGYAGLKTWRLPTIQELETLSDYSRTNPSIDTTVFPATLKGYWSSTTFAANSTYAWFVSFAGGEVSYFVNSSSSYLRCVSGLSKGDSSNFTDNSDGTVKDNATGLIWQKCSQGQNNDATCTGAATTATWATAIAYCSGLGLEGKTWRLPHVNELKTIVDTTKATSPVIDTTAFPATVASYYWSSSTYAQTTTNAWFVDFVFGLVGGLSKTANVYVRCVSGP